MSSSFGKVLDLGCPNSSKKTFGVSRCTCRMIFSSRLLLRGAVSVGVYAVGVREHGQMLNLKELYDLYASSTQKFSGRSNTLDVMELEFSSMVAERKQSEWLRRSKGPELLQLTAPTASRTQNKTCQNPALSHARTG